MIHYEIKIKKKKKKELPDQKQASNGAILGADNRASRSKNELPTELFPAPPTELLDRRTSFQIESLLWMPISTLRPDQKKALDADDSGDEENERVVELFGMWSKIDADDLSAWVGVGWRVSDRGEKNKKERILNRKKAKRRREKERKI